MKYYKSNSNLREEKCTKEKKMKRNETKQNKTKQNENEELLWILKYHIKWYDLCNITNLIQLYLHLIRSLQKKIILIIDSIHNKTKSWSLLIVILFIDVQDKLFHKISKVENKMVF